MIVDAAWYEGAARQPMHRPIRRIAAHRVARGFAWIGLHDPTDDELDEVRDAFELPELAVADARNNYDRPKVERHGDCLLTVVPTARYVDDTESIEFGEIFFYSGEDYLITVRLGAASPLQQVRREIEAHPERFKDGPAVVLRAALPRVVQSYEPVIDGLTHDAWPEDRRMIGAISPNDRRYRRRKVSGTGRAPHVRDLERMTSQTRPPIRARLVQRATSLDVRRCDVELTGGTRCGRRGPSSSDGLTGLRRSAAHLAGGVGSGFGQLCPRRRVDGHR